MDIVNESQNNEQAYSDLTEIEIPLFILTQNDKKINLEIIDLRSSKINDIIRKSLNNKQGIIQTLQIELPKQIKTN